MAKALDITAKNNLDHFYAQNQDVTETLIKNAILNLRDGTPGQKHLHDYLAHDYFAGSDENTASNMQFDENFGFVENPDSDVNNSDIVGEVTKKETQDIIDYNDTSDPNYLSRVSGQVITMPDGEVRTYSKNGHSYTIPAKSWMGVGDSTRQITTHNKLSGNPMPVSDQYIGISDEQARPFYMLAATGGAGKVTTAASRGLNLVRTSAKFDAANQIDKAAGSPIGNFISNKINGQ
tara:strand:+ start:765 stop:1469 length:705 start_codon:yes stop_codon:yes gene_type:complete